jgi:type II secretory pathway component PulF
MMPQFTYIAKEGPQKIVEGIIEAESVDNAIAKVLNLGYTPIDVKGAEHQRSSFSLASIKFSFPQSKKVSGDDLTLFTRQMFDLADAGVPILQALRLITKQTTSPVFKEIIVQIHTVVKDGGSLSGALAEHPAVFRKFYVNMVKAGELAGNLPTILGRLAEFMEKDQETRAQVKTSLIYPSVILVVAGLSIFGLFTFAIPRITAIFDDLSETLPLPTVIVIGISDFLKQFWWLVVGVIAGLVTYIKRLGTTPKGKLQIDQFVLKIPLFGNFIKTAEVGRFARSLATLLDGGVTIVNALESVYLVLENEVLKSEVKHISQEVANGVSLAGAMQGSTVFPDAAISMISVGEESGNLQKGLYKLAEYYDRQTQQFVKRITSLIEPALIIFLGLVVGFIFVAMLLPVLRMNLMIK